jgi:type VI secretion system secreted protein VgrG
MTPLQTARQISVTTPLGEDVLLFHRMTATEELGRMFRFDLDLLSRDPNIRFDKILGQNITIRLDLQGGGKRYFNGVVSRFSQAGTWGNYHAYRATVHPWLWFLTRTADCRIFQSKTVPDIIKEVFRAHGFTDLRDALGGVTYRTWDYCVQYRETDFNFVSRLMEQEGIYYFFQHDNGKHTLVLANAMTSHDPVPGYERITYYPPENEQHRREDHIFDWSLTQEVQPGIYALNDYDFKQPKANLQVKSSIARKHDWAGMEIYDYPGEYVTSAEGEAYVRTRVEELQADFERAHGQANARGLAAGYTFTLHGYPRADQNREYLVVSATHVLESDAYDSASGAGNNEVYSCSLAAMHTQEVFRPARLTPKPIVQGPQTAVVVGPAGEEIHTDKYGRVKVQFHWDRYGKADQNSSCWVRVSQLWAGTQWGGIHLPRIGQEVIISFLEGDPDQPIITGRVYNNDQMPPYSLPANATQSGIKSRSSKGGSPANFNEFRFEDRKGSEEIYLHGEKDWNIIIENNKTQSVGVNESLSVGNNRTKTVGVDQSETIGKNKTIVVGANHTEAIGINCAETIGVAKELTIGGLYQVTVGAAMNETVGAAKAVEVGAAHTLLVGKDMSVQVAKNSSHKAKKITIEADDEITIKTGKALINMKKSGDITIQGKKITIKGSGDVVIKGSKILEN